MNEKSKSTAEIKMIPCPFCGGPPVLRWEWSGEDGQRTTRNREPLLPSEIGVFLRTYVSCHECGAAGPAHHGILCEREEIEEIERLGIGLWNLRDGRHDGLYVANEATKVIAFIPEPSVGEASKMTLEEELREGGSFGDGCICVACRAADRIRSLEAELHNTQLAATQNKVLADQHFQRSRALEAMLRRIVEKPKDPASWAADLVRLAPPAETPHCQAFDVQMGTGSTSQVQHVCSCEFGECRKRELKSDQYCHNDRKAAPFGSGDA